MAVETTKIGDIINPEVMGNMIEAKIEAQCKLTPYAHVNTDLQGVPGDTLTVPSWNYIGDAEDFNPETASDSDAEMATTKLTASTTKFTVKCAGKSVSILQTAINSGLGDPVGQANLQLAKSVVNKIDNDLMEAAYTCKNIYAPDAAIGYAGIVDAVSKFEDEEDGIDKVIFIHPNQEATLLKDSDFLSADKFEAGVAVNGAIGKIAGCWVKKSRKVKLENGYYLCPIIKMEADSSETEYTEDELPALTIFLKKDTQVDHEWFPKKQRHDITAAKYYGVALTNAAKVVIAKFKNGERLDTSIAAVRDRTKTEYGMKLSDLMGEDVDILKDGSVIGTLPYVENFKGFDSKNTDLQKGHFMVITLGEEYKKKFKVQRISGTPGTAKEVTNDEVLVLRLTDGKDTVFKVTADNQPDLVFNFARATLK